MGAILDAFGSRARRAAHHLVLLTTVFLALIGSAPSALAVVGGPDILVAGATSIFDDIRAPSLGIASSGQLFLAVVGRVPPAFPTTCVIVYQSPNGGITWHPWGSIVPAPGDAITDPPSLHVAEGVQDRVFVSYGYRLGSTGNTELRVSWSPIYVENAVFEPVTAINLGGTSTATLSSLTSDAGTEFSYTLYLAALTTDATGVHISVTHSTSFGAGWDAPYTIAYLGSALDGAPYHYQPQITCGRPGRVHCAWAADPLLPGSREIWHRRALNRAAAGLADWEPAVQVSPAGDGIYHGSATIAASRISDRVLVADDEYYFTVGDAPARVFVSNDGGATWPLGSSASFEPLTRLPALLALPFPEEFVCALIGPVGGGLQMGLARTTDATSLVWTPFTPYGDPSHPAQFHGYPHGVSVAMNPQRACRVGLASAPFGVGMPDSLFFDSEWLSPDGTPSVHCGFPVLLAAPADSDPLLVRLESAPHQDIVFTDNEGYLHAIRPDGSEVPGWPVFIPGFSYGTPVVAGDLNGDGTTEIYVGSKDGRIFGFHPDGSYVPGWPINLGTLSPIYLSIGALSPVSHRQLVACFESRIHAYRPGGLALGGFPVIRSGTINSPAAIGPVVNNGQNQIVVASSSGIEILNSAGGIHSGIYFPTLVSSGVALADVDLDGTMEYAFGLRDGRIYLCGPGSAVRSGWPYQDPTLNAIEHVVFSDLLGTAEPEVVATATSGRAHLLLANGAPGFGWPKTIVGSPQLGYPIVETLDGGSPDVVFTSENRNAYAFENLSAALPNWPVPLTDGTLLSPASGDIDADGMVDLVLLAGRQLYRIGTDAPLARNSLFKQWPMFGYNPARTSCLGCGPDLIASTPPTTPWQKPLLRVSGPATTGRIHIVLDLPEAAQVELALFDVAGRRVRQLPGGAFPAGEHEIEVDFAGGSGSALPSGIYFVRLMADRASGRLTAAARLAIIN